MKAIFGIVICSYFLNFFSCKLAKTSRDEKDSLIHVEDKYCNLIDTLIQEKYVMKTGNYFANKIIPKLEDQSKILARCDKGTLGYLYFSDTLFDSDIKKWKQYFNCK